ncbi:hypothetical protein PTSG_11900 [Salpingoeca rosetta]|uniref:Reticulon domain-containing protein n=1 Tax=Salpingoeca rosetta (strain ATCC 50818 / BSB-021) TaxID=946362 RepID=F2U2Y3_SALR5|nr:uncharacterized protein PTSG_11900 [Salpingoeca rosetta]EGD81977.1 hypothetical protein PTSG_11900 [Salpingoeca rosetta]|eukprot:XP_004996160.1 hypothetical protein PTSG_11900 [Salpingoeca rosetta]
MRRSLQQQQQQQRQHATQAATSASSSSASAAAAGAFCCERHKDWDEFLFHQRHICVLFQSVMHPRRHPKRFLATLLGWTAFCVWLPFWNASVMSFLFLCVAALAIPAHFILCYQRNMKSKNKKITNDQRIAINQLAGKIASAHSAVETACSRLAALRTSRPIVYVIIILALGSFLFGLFSWVISDIMLLFICGLCALFVLSDCSVDDVMRALHLAAAPQEPQRPTRFKRD